MDIFIKWVSANFMKICKYYEQLLKYKFFKKVNNVDTYT